MSSEDEFMDYGDENRDYSNKPAKKKKGRAKAGGKKTIEQTYQKKSQLEHILLRPDTYIGSIKEDTREIFVYDAENSRMVKQEITFVPGLYKCFDELLVNAADNRQRDGKMDQIKVEVNREKGFISVFNNGRGIPVQKHKEHGIYVPELIFGHLLTGSNFDDNEKKTTGGRNGFGAKLANIFSKKFIVETVDADKQKKFKQVFHNNMQKKDTPSLSSFSGKPYTKVTFYPDFSKFIINDRPMHGIDSDLEKLILKRTVDVAGCSPHGVRVYFNGNRVPVKNFNEYVKLFLWQQEGTKVLHEKINERWEICVANSDGHFEQVSFVNSIWTMTGGTHVNYVADQISKRMIEEVKKKNKKMVIKPQLAKNQLWVFVNALIENPAFNSQTKETLTSKSKEFGSTCVLPENLMKAIMKSGVIRNVLDFAKFKESKDLKKSDGKKVSKLTGIPKLEDANDAGTKHASKCTLILTEGDSAKALAMSGLTVVGRDHYGVFPLKGKLLNVRDAAHKQIMGNAEISNIKKILGLKANADYSPDTSQGRKNFGSLRYGSIMIMADQDFDGSHIKGLVVNFVHHFYPSLFRRPEFLTQFITPIVVCKKRNQIETFYTVPEYEHWRETHNNGSGWAIKYYKGLGTSTAAEAKKYFGGMTEHKIEFRYTGRADDEAIELAFSKKKADARKQWLSDLVEGTFIDLTQGRVAYHDFVNKELILFSQADNARSIPSMVDGLKPGQRKILFSCFKRKLKKELKVAQLSGYVSEHSAYHHGEMSLNGTIVGLAQNFVGSNNINILYPGGQFGTRNMGGKDAASPRYIFTKLADITRHIFHPEDDALLKYLDDDGLSIEPHWYMPVVPLVLINGAEGIGTGWSTHVPNYNPRDVINNLKLILTGAEPKPMHPWYRGFEGTLEPVADKPSYAVTGRIELISVNTLLISELPVKKWTQDYKEFLETLMIDGGPVKDVRAHHTDNTVSFTVTVTPEARIMEVTGELKKRFKLTSSLSVGNMVLFDHNGSIVKYQSAVDILKDFYKLRMHFYVERKKAMILRLDEELRRLSNKARLIKYVIEGKVKINNVKKADIIKKLESLKFEKFAVKQKTSSSDEGEGEQSKAKKSYDYLLTMPLWSLTKERYEALMKERDGKNEELVIIKKTSEKHMWLTDLDNFEKSLEKFEEEQDEIERADAASRDKGQKGKKGKGRNKAPTKSRRKPNKTTSIKASDLTQDDDDMVMTAADFKKPAKKTKRTGIDSVTSGVGRMNMDGNGSHPMSDDSSDDAWVAPPTLGLADRLQKRMNSKTILSADSDSDDDTIFKKPTPTISRVTKKKVGVKRKQSKKVDSAGNPFTSQELQNTSTPAKASPPPKRKPKVQDDYDSSSSDDEAIIIRKGRSKKTKPKPSSDFEMSDDE